jgi:hypothetical protein
MDNTDIAIKIGKEALELCFEQIRLSLIIKSISDEELNKKEFCEIDFAEKYGFFMPKQSLYKFDKIVEKLTVRKQFIIKPLMVYTRIQFLIYLIYIKLYQWKLRRRAKQIR